MSRQYKLITEEEMQATVGGTTTLAAIAIIGTATILAVAVFKLYQSFKGKINLPGGFNIEWQTS